MKKTVIGLVVSALFLDQLTKYLAQHFIGPGDRIQVFGDFVRLQLVRNRGGAFGLFANIPHPYREYVFYIISVIALAILLYLFIKCPRENHLMHYALALIGGGALGNLYDRIIFGEVVDFIDMGLKPYTLRWPTYNVADIAITVGVFLVLLDTLRSFKHEDSPEPACQPDDA